MLTNILNIILMIAGLQITIVVVAVVLIRFLGRRSAAKAGPSMGSPADYLTDEIDRTQIVLNGPLPDEVEGMRAILDARINYLTAEQAAHAASLEEPEHFWNRLAEALELPLARAAEATEPEPPPEPEAEPEPEAAVVAATPEAEPEVDEAREDDEKQMLRELVETYEGRVNGLEVFRDQFFDLKEQLEKVQSSHEELQEELERVLPQSERSEQLEKLNSILKEEKASLESRLNKLSNGAKELGAREEKPAGSPAERTAKVEKEVDDIASRMEDQQSILKGLKEEAKSSSLDKDELLELVEKIDGLQEKLQDIRAKSRDLESENRKLRGDLQEAMGESKSKDLAIDDYRETVDDLKTLVVEQKERIRDLNLELGQSSELSTEMESMKEMIQELTAKNAEMLMCIYTLEDENDFLKDQISELLKIDKGASQADIKEATGDAVSSAAHQQEVDDLKGQLKEKNEAYSALQKKFANMEKEYLDMYAEMRSKG